MPHVNKKTARKRIFVQIPFSHSTLKFKQKIFTTQKHSLFRSISGCGVIKSLLQFDFKNHENVWADLKNRPRPNTIQIVRIVKK